MLIRAQSDRIGVANVLVNSPRNPREVWQNGDLPTHGLCSPAWTRREVRRM